ncbi:copper chaperone PCu(A)C [Paracoccus tibetensis]|uniref:Copper(I)-binding protein n=1 Tax=Paracoccus tibetensis TaxID=336292 RepID=A0A1G5IZZ8_9RHOB|nr:copper chaperone PCu(A)C [Paracoccus tibetensis]SCY81632.1 hypothetical protein SAMN05660710_02910 [Paracoccus tibetensis]
MKSMTLAAAATLLPLAGLAADLTVEDAYLRSANPMTGAAFMRIDNPGEAACMLTAVTSDVAERIELHTHEEEDGVMRMRRIEGGIAIPAGSAVQLDRGGDHVMLLGLTRSLADGDRVAFQLDLGDCGTQEVEAVVDNTRDASHAAEGADPHADHSGH